MVAISGCAIATGSGMRAQPRAEISMVSGELHITNSRDGQAIFQAQGLAPGRSVTGTVQLSNTGSLAGELGFQQVDVTDQPGPCSLDSSARSRAEGSATSRPASRARTASRRRFPTAAPRPARAAATTRTQARP